MPHSEEARKIAEATPAQFGLGSLNKRQRHVLFATAGIIVLMLFFPPYHTEIGQGITTSRGYSAIWAPPKSTTGYAELYAVINAAVLLAQVVVVTIAGLLVTWALRSRGNESGDSSTLGRASEALSRKEIWSKFLAGAVFLLMGVLFVFAEDPQVQNLVSLGEGDVVPKSDAAVEEDYLRAFGKPRAAEAGAGSEPSGGGQDTPEYREFLRAFGKLPPKSTATGKEVYSGIDPDVLRAFGKAVPDWTPERSAAPPPESWISGKVRALPLGANLALKILGVLLIAVSGATIIPLVRYLFAGRRTA